MIYKHSAVNIIVVARRSDSGSSANTATHNGEPIVHFICFGSA